MGKPNRNRHFRAIAQAILQALAFKHLKPTSPLREGAVTSRAHPKVSANSCRRFPVDYDPFAADGVAQQSQIQQAQAEPRGPLQQQPATGAGQPDAVAPAATPTDPLTSNGVLTPLRENGKVDSYVYAKNSTGTPPAGPQVTTAKGNLTITATDNAKTTNFGGVYGHTLTFSEPGTNNLATFTATDPTGLLVATPDEGDPSGLRVREYKGY